MFKKISSYLISLIMPGTCLICNKIISSGQFCQSDFNKLEFICDPRCNICGTPFKFEVFKGSSCVSCLTKVPKYDKAISVLKYNEFSKSFILAFKYSDKTSLSKFFANLMFDASKDVLDDIDFVSFVPLHKNRLKKRKYNQSLLIAKEFSKLSKLPLIYNLLIRVKDTKAQFMLSKKGRERNLQGAFKLNNKYNIEGKNILIIDDVITTGATVNECCKVLKRGKVGKIYVLTVAKTVLN